MVRKEISVEDRLWVISGRPDKTAAFLTGKLGRKLYLPSFIKLWKEYITSLQALNQPAREASFKKYLNTVLSSSTFSKFEHC